MHRCGAGSLRGASGDGCFPLAGTRRCLQVPRSGAILHCVSTPPDTLWLSRFWFSNEISFTFKLPNPPAEAGDISVQGCLEWLMISRERHMESTWHENMDKNPCAESLTLPSPHCTHPSSLLRYPQELIGRILLPHVSPTHQDRGQRASKRSLPSAIPDRV